MEKNRIVKIAFHNLNILFSEEGDNGRKIITVLLHNLSHNVAHN